MLLLCPMAVLYHPLPSPTELPKSTTFYIPFKGDLNALLVVPHDFVSFQVSSGTVLLLLIWSLSITMLVLIGTLW